MPAFVHDEGAGKVRWRCLHLSALPEVDDPGAETLKHPHSELTAAGVRLVLADTLQVARDELDRALGQP